MARAPFVWEGVEHWYGRDLMDTLILISEQDEADSFLSAYAEACDDDEHALHNVRYMVELIAFDGENKTAKEDAQRICDFYGLDMPKASEVISPRQWFKNSSLGVKTEKKERVEA